MSRTFHHAHKSPTPGKGRMCHYCGLALVGYWQRRFCSNACKQAAYRDRTRKATEKNLRHVPQDMPPPPKSARFAGAASHRRR